MCRNIKKLFNFDPPTTEEEVHDAALQFVRKISGFRKPSKVNEGAFHSAIADITQISARLLAALQTSVPLQPRPPDSRSR